MPEKEVDGKQAAALLRASATGDVRQVQKLLKRTQPAPPHMFAAVQSGVKQVVALHAAANAELCNTTLANGTTPLYLAVTKGSGGMVEELLNHSRDAKALVNTPTAVGSTSLMAACEQGNPAIVEQLLAAGADATTAARCKDGSSATPLYVASQHGYTPIVELLLATFGNCGSGVLDLPCTDGATALHVASQHRHTRIVEALLSSGAQVNVRTTAGSSPLLLAAAQGNAEVIAMLCAHSADPDYEAPDGQTPLIAACQAGSWQTVLLGMRSGGGSPGGEAMRPQLAIPKLLLHAGCDPLMHMPMPTPVHMHMPTPVHMPMKHTLPKLHAGCDSLACAKHTKACIHLGHPAPPPAAAAGAPPLTVRAPAGMLRAGPRSTCHMAHATCTCHMHIRAGPRSTCPMPRMHMPHAHAHAQGLDLPARWIAQSVGAGRRRGRRRARRSSSHGADAGGAPLVDDEHMPHAHATCTCHMHMPHAHATCTCHMPHAHDTCHMTHATCTFHMHRCARRRRRAPSVGRPTGRAAASLSRP